MQNIDPVFMVQPALVIMICAGLLLYWRRKRHFELTVFWYSLLAYAVAIALKYVVQSIPISASLNDVELGVYYGFQTVVFEVGLAYAVAWYAVSHCKLERKDAEAYGAGLAFWENAVLLGILPLIDLVAYYGILSSNTPLAQMVYDQLVKNAQAYFDPVPQALGLVAWGTFERISSIMIHSAWGFLCFAGVYFHKKRLFLIALPMGFIDFLVPFADRLGLAFFEIVIFAIGVLAVLVARYATRSLESTASKEEKESTTSLL